MFTIITIRFSVHRSRNKFLSHRKMTSVILSNLPILFNLKFDFKNCVLCKVIQICMYPMRFLCLIAEYISHTRKHDGQGASCMRHKTRITQLQQSFPNNLPLCKRQRMPVRPCMLMICLHFYPLLLKVGRCNSVQRAGVC